MIKGRCASTQQGIEWQAQYFASCLCPDFVIELHSPTDSLKELQEKMREYMDNGAGLGWLIDPTTRRVEIYRPDRDVEILENPTTASGEGVLPGFTLSLDGIIR